MLYTPILVSSSIVEVTKDRKYFHWIPKQITVGDDTPFSSIRINISISASASASALASNDENVNRNHPSFDRNQHQSLSAPPRTNGYYSSILYYLFLLFHPSEVVIVCEVVRYDHQIRMVFLLINWCIEF